PDTLDFYLQKALDESSSTSDPATLFSLPSSSPPSPIPLNPNGPNNLFLYPGSFSPPHAGHLATILYFYEHRHDFGISCLFIFADPETVVGGRVKKHNVFVMPQEFRYILFATHPLLFPLLQTGFLKILTGSMASHIAFLRRTTDLIASHHIPVTLTGFLGGDKLSLHSQPHQKPGELIEWGPVDEFMIMNARRPIDIDFPPSNKPDNLPGCTAWERGPVDFENLRKESRIGQLWSCLALTVPGEPVIRFRASDRSASNGISSTKIRKIMCEVEDAELLGELKHMVISPEVLVEWLVRER
ncbi:hypothetical protein DL98DRAFT_367367, partial [Cadophora sp. DSE1049]